MSATIVRHPGARPLPGRAIAIAAAFAFGWAAVLPTAARSAIGPSGGTFSSVAGSQVSPLDLEAATYFGVIWTSKDGGLSWELTGSLAGDQQWAAGTRLTVSSNQAGTVYASTELAGAFKSNDSGANWRPLEPWITGLAVTPSEAPNLYATRLMAGSGAPGASVLAVEVSIDEGGTWSVAGVLPLGWQAAELTVDPIDPATIYALGTPGLAKSTDSGAHWTTLFSPYGPGDSPLAVIAVRNTSTVYIASAQPAGDGGASVWRSGDGGVNWTAADAGLPRPLLSLARTPSGTLYAAALVAGGTQVFASADGGTTWHRTASLGVVAPVVAGIEATDHLFGLAFRGGLLASLDQGHTWSAPARPPSGADITQVLSGPPPNSEIYVAEAVTASETEFLRSFDNGVTWSPLAPTPQQHPRKLVSDAQPGRLYALDSSPPQPALWSVDDGASWQPMPAPGGLAALDLAADRAVPGKLLELACAVTSDAPQGGPACSSYSLYGSATFGLHWRLLGKLDQGGYPAGLVRLDPADPATAYAVIGGTLYKTAAGSPHLHPLPLRPPVADLAADPKAPGTLYAGIAISGPNDARRPLWKSVNGGASWSPASAGLPRGAFAPVLVVDPAKASTIYLGNSLGVFVSHDGARTWNQVNVGLVGLRVTSLAVSTSFYQEMFAGTQSAGAFRLR